FRREVDRMVEMAALSQEQIDAILRNAEKQRERMAKLTPEQRRALSRLPEAKQRSERVRTACQLQPPLARVVAGLLARLAPAQWTTLLQGQEPLVLATDPGRGELPLPDAVSRDIRTIGPSVPGARAAERSRLRDQEQRERWAAASGFRVIIQPDTANAKGGSLAVNLSVTPFAAGTLF